MSRIVLVGTLLRAVIGVVGTTASQHLVCRTSVWILVPTRSPAILERADDQHRSLPRSFISLTLPSVVWREGDGEC